jgi:hypothetical protein
VVRPDLALAERQHLARSVKRIDRRRLFNRQPEHRSLADGGVVQRQIVLVQIDRRRQHSLRPRDAGDVIDMSMRQQNEANGQLTRFDVGEKRANLVARIDEHRLPRLVTCHQKAVLEERADGPRLD